MRYGFYGTHLTDWGLVGNKGYYYAGNIFGLGFRVGRECGNIFYRDHIPLCPTTESTSKVSHTANLGPGVAALLISTTAFYGVDHQRAMPAMCKEKVQCTTLACEYAALLSPGLFG